MHYSIVFLVLCLYFGDKGVFKTVAIESYDIGNHSNTQVSKIPHKLKHPVSTLSKSLRKKVEILQKAVNKSDIVFLIDASSSIGNDNFKSEIQFVRKLLSDFIVSENETRISLITFGNQDSIVRYVDHISSPSEENHKCNILHRDLPRILYSGGSTFTVGALTEAQFVLQWSRSSSLHAIFLITDGFSNGGDPVPVAQSLANNGTSIFTFGIRTGNIEELMKISSSPVDEHSYFLDSFVHFESLARRALHHDIAIDIFQKLNNYSQCNTLCPDEENTDTGCCDSKASCACGTRSGHFACLCSAGYYGSGLRGMCFPCPSGTYHDGSIPGDISVCSPCPDPNHITLPGTASSKNGCRCKAGFVAKGDACNIVTCPLLQPPQNGYFVKGFCPNITNSACGVRCTVGYKLHGSSIRLCQDNGTWSGDSATCVVKTCPQPEILQEGNMNCSTEAIKPHAHGKFSNLYRVDTECEFSCSEGYFLSGSKRRVCLPLGRWGGLRSICKALSCPPLSDLAQGTILPKVCVQSNKLHHDTICNMTCNQGFSLVGPPVRVCNGKDGQWTDKTEVSQCVDIEPPIIVCPNDIMLPTEAGKSFATVDWDAPSVFDNSGKDVFVWTYPVSVLPMKLTVGSFVMSYIAMDSSRNKASCNFTISVLDIEPPVVKTCLSPQPFFMNPRGNHIVFWAEPEFYDNSNKPLKIVRTHEFGSFPLGTTYVKYTAYDVGGNNNSCVINITVLASPCDPVHYKPLHGTIKCSDEFSCNMTCEKGYAFAPKGQDNTFTFSKDGFSFLFSCDETVKNNFVSNSAVLPKCSEFLPPTLEARGELIVSTGRRDFCHNISLMQELSSSLMEKMQGKLREVCGNKIECNIKILNATCNGIFPQPKKMNYIHMRRRRSFVHRRLQKNVPDSKEPSINVQFNFVAEVRKALERVSTNQEGIISVKDLNRIKVILNASLANDSVLLNERINLIKMKDELKIRCFKGSVFHKSGKMCVKCPIGSFYSSSQCHPCPLGEYQNLEGQLNCMRCSLHQTTSKKGSHDSSYCKALCPPGSFGSTFGIEPCTLCGVGWYQPNYGENDCIRCPSSTLPRAIGAKSLQDCSDSQSSYFASSNSVTCHTKPCKNGGICMTLASGLFACECSSPYFGSFCEFLPKDCDSSPCVNGGSCLQQNKDYNCLCRPGYTGKSCEIDINECISNPCENDGICHDLVNGFRCTCLDGSYGDLCENVVDECFDNPCGTGGSCISKISNYTCRCFEGFFGHHCEQRHFNLCNHDHLCKNGGSCVLNQTLHPFCICPKGLTGMFCETVENICQSSPCLNNGTCMSDNGTYKCTCKSSFSGNICQTKSQSNWVLHFSESRSTNYVIKDIPPRKFSEISVCLWLSSNDGFNYGTPFSYATKNHFNTLTLTDYNGFVLYVNDERVITDVPANDGYWHHVCITWKSRGGEWNIYLDGILQEKGENLSANTFVMGGGKFVVGQEQDSLGGGFSEAESFVGHLYNLNIWDHILSATDVQTFFKECHHNEIGTVINWENLLSGVKGKLKMENSTFCSKCPNPVDFHHGTVTVLKKDAKMVAFYVCQDGYVFNKNVSLPSVERFCLKQGIWEGKAPLCVRRSCGFPGYFPGGTLKGQSFLYNDSVFFECHTGYEMIGNSERVCGKNGVWSGQQPVCIGKQCKIPDSPDHGQVIIVSTNSTGFQTVNFSCNEGYYLDGASNISCMFDGTWNEIVPDCLPVSCSSPPKIENTSMKEESNETVFFYGQTVTYHCNEGYESINSTIVIHCSYTGAWVLQNNITVCDIMNELCSPVVYCPDLEPLQHGTWEVLKRTSESNATYFHPGSVIIVKCDYGFEHDGPDKKECLRNGDWFPPDLTQCAKITCDTEDLPVDIPNSNLDLSGEEFGDTAKLSCKDNFQLALIDAVRISFHNITGSEMEKFSSLSWQCELDGSWHMQTVSNILSEDMLVACVENATESHVNKTCGHPEAPRFAYLVEDSTENQTFVANASAGSVVQIRCRPGYILHGNSSFTCHRNGTWLGSSSAICQPVKCSDPPFYPHMAVTSSTAVNNETQFGNMITYGCLDGNTPLGDLILRCQSNGEWSPMRGNCTPPVLISN